MRLKETAVVFGILESYKQTIKICLDRVLVYYLSHNTNTAYNLYFIIIEGNRCERIGSHNYFVEIQTSVSR